MLYSISQSRPWYVVEFGLHFATSLHSHHLATALCVSCRFVVTCGGETASCHFPKSTHVCLPRPCTTSSHASRRCVFLPLLQLEKCHISLVPLVTTDAAITGAVRLNFIRLATACMVFLEAHAVKAATVTNPTPGAGAGGGAGAGATATEPGSDSDGGDSAVAPPLATPQLPAIAAAVDAVSVFTQQSPLLFSGLAALASAAPPAGADDSSQREGVDSSNAEQLAQRVRGAAWRLQRSVDAVMLHENGRFQTTQQSCTQTDYVVPVITVSTTRSLSITRSLSTTCCRNSK